MLINFLGKFFLEGYNHIDEQRLMLKSYTAQGIKPLFDNNFKWSIRTLNHYVAHLKLLSAFLNEKV